MTKKKLYRYSGRNGILTTCVLLDGINHIPVFELKAGEGKILTNGEKTVYSIIVEEDAIKDWKEIKDNTNQSN